MLTLEKIKAMERVARGKGGAWNAEMQLLASDVQELCRRALLVEELVRSHEARAQKLRKVRSAIGELSVEQVKQLQGHELWIKRLLGELPLNSAEFKKQQEEKAA